MDQELLEAGIEVIRELSEARKFNLPISSQRDIATQMLKNDKLGDNDWCEDMLKAESKRFNKRLNFAKEKNFYPFVNVGLGACIWIRKKYGPWTLSLMESKLLNPFDAHSYWAIRFAATMKEAGFKDCKSADDLHSFITNHPSWKEMRKEAKTWSEYIKQIKNKKKRLH